MLELNVYDGEHEVVLKFEHSLLSLSKWESRTKRAFLTNVRKTPEEMIAYYQDMLVSPEDETDLIYLLDPKQLTDLDDYINSKQSASYVPEQKNSKYNPEVTTSELIYYWLVGLQIPFHPVETWHVSRVMMLVQITSFKNQPPEKRKRPDGDTMREWAALNEARLKKYNTTG